MVQHIRKRRLKPRMHALRNRKHLRHAKTHRRRSRPLQYPHSRIAKPPRTHRSRRKRRKIEVLRSRLPRVKVLRHHIRPNHRTTVRHIRIRLVRRRTDARRLPRPRLQQRHVRQIPSSQHHILPSAARHPRSTRTKRKLIHRRQQHPVTPRSLHIAVVLLNVEAVGNRNAIVHLTRKRTRSIALVVRLILRKRIVRVEVQPMQPSDAKPPAPTRCSSPSPH